MTSKLLTRSASLCRPSFRTIAVLNCLSTVLFIEQRPGLSLSVMHSLEGSVLTALIFMATRLSDIYGDSSFSCLTPCRHRACFIRKHDLFLSFGFPAMSVCWLLLRTLARSVAWEWSAKTLGGLAEVHARSADRLVEQLCQPMESTVAALNRTRR